MDNHVVEFIEELGYRFPDMTNEEVMLAWSEYCQVSLVPFPESFLGQRILSIYEKGVNRSNV